MKSLGVVILALFCIYSDARITTEIREFGNVWSNQEKIKYYYEKYYEKYENDFAVAACTKDKLPTEMHCNVTINHWTTNNTTPIKNTCGLKLVADGNRTIAIKTNIIDFVERFGEDRIVVIWYERDADTNEMYEFSVQKVTILNMKNCSTTNVTIHLDMESNKLISNILLYNDTFDMVSSSKSMCNGASVCRVTYDKEGKQISGPVPFTTDTPSLLYPVASNSPSKGFFGLSWIWEQGTNNTSLILNLKYKLSYFSPSDKQTDLLTVYEPDIYWPGLSNVQEKLGFCYVNSKKDAKIHCAQFDPHSREMMVLNTTLTLNLKLGERIESTNVHNLKDGILLAAIVKPNDNAIADQKSSELIVMKIKPNGLKREVIRINGLDSKCSYASVKIFENSDEFCFRIICESEYSTFSSRLSVDVKCIPKYPTRKIVIGK